MVSKCSKISTRPENMFLRKYNPICYPLRFLFSLGLGLARMKIYMFESFWDDSDVWLCLWILVTLLLVSASDVSNCLTGNIFISRTSIPNAASEEGDEDDWASNKVMFKIGKKER